MDMSVLRLRREFENQDMKDCRVLEAWLKEQGLRQRSAGVSAKHQVHYRLY